MSNDSITTIRAAPFHDESQFTILIRSSHYNGWQSPIQFASVYSGHNMSTALSRLGSPVHMRALATSLDFPAGVLDEIVYKNGGVTASRRVEWKGLLIPVHFIRHQRTAVCVECLKTDPEPYGRSEWDLRLVRSCRRHRCVLLTHCPACNWPIETIRSAVAFCRCGFDFRTAHRTAESTCGELRVLDDCLNARSTECLEAAFALYDSLEEASGAGALNNSATTDVVAERIFFSLDSAAEHFRPAAGPNDGISVRLALRRFFTCRSSDLVRNILRSFGARCIYRVAGNWDHLLTEPVSGAKARAILGAGQGAFSRIKTTKLIPFVKREGTQTSYFELAALDHILRHAMPGDGAIGQDRLAINVTSLTTDKLLKGLADGAFKSTGYDVATGLQSLRIVGVKRRAPVQIDGLTVQQVAQLCNAHENYIHSLVASGFLNSHKVKGSNRYVIYEDDAIKFNETYVFGGTLAKEDGVKPNGYATGLINAGILPVSGPGIDGGRTYLFKRSTLVDYRGELAARRHPRPREIMRLAAKNDLIQLADACNKLNISIQAGKGLMLQGLLKRVETGGTKVMIDAASLDELKRLLDSPDWTDLQKAADLANESIWQFRRKWIYSGLVEEKDLFLARRVRTSDLRMILTLKEDFISSSDCARIVHSHKTFARSNFSIGALPSIILGVEPAIIRLFPRSAIADLVGEPT